MRSTVCALALVTTSVLSAQQPAPQQAATAPEDPIATMVGRLDLEKYKATIKGLTQFGDRRQGTARNRAALDWIEAQLKSYGCTNTERISYTYTPRPAGGGGRGAAGGGRTRTARAGRRRARRWARPAGRRTLPWHARPHRRELQPR